RGDAVIANSRFTAENVRSQYEGKPYFSLDKMTVIPRGADLSRFDPATISQERIEPFRALLGMGLRVVLPGRFTDWKGQRVLIEAAKILHERRPELLISYAAIGRMDEKPDYVAELRRLIDEAGLAGRFQLLPSTDDVPALLAASDVVVSASTDPEAFGRVAVEAQATGTPSIATAHGGSLETVKDGETGILVPPGDPEALATAIAAVNDKGDDERRAMGSRGMEHARQAFTTEAMTSATLEVYAKVLKLRGE
ncbi:MAG: glycosyltransferase family 4 protein, partial [Planctomycetota bacterium]